MTCIHIWTVDESHPQIIRERQHGTERLNICLICGQEKSKVESFLALGSLPRTPVPRKMKCSGCGRIYKTTKR